MANQSKIQRKMAPLAVRPHLMSLIRFGVSSKDLLEYYQAEQINGRVSSDSEDNSGEQNSETPYSSCVASSGNFGCPWCGTHIKLAKDFIRHANHRVDRQKCAAVSELRCIDCGKKFTRKSRVAKHHQKKHPLSCGPGACTHIGSATVPLPGTKLLRCGFCAELFESDLYGYLRHLIKHYIQGALLRDWQPGPHVPGGAVSSPPPQVTLDVDIENETGHSDFSAFRSGFGLPAPEMNSRSVSNIANHPNSYNGSHYDVFQPFHSDANMNTIPDNNDTSFDAMPLAGLDDAYGYTASGLNTFNDGLCLFDTCGGWINDSPVVTEAHDQLLDADYQHFEAEFASKMPPYNATPPLAPEARRKKSFQSRIFENIQGQD